MLVLGIESTCDETAFAIVKDGKEILANELASQMDLLKLYGGVVPELASRRHEEMLLPLLERALTKAEVTLDEIYLIAVAKGPGLIGAVLVGLNAAKGLALGLDIPLIGVNHIEAHLHAVQMSTDSPIPMPALGVVLSGGHTSLVRINDIGEYELLGQTADDAIGEAFDKAARILKLSYPGGPQIEALAKLGDPSRFNFKAGSIRGRPLDFSFSGLKTAVLYAAKGAGSNSRSPLKIAESEKPDIAAAFQEAAFDDVIKKIQKAATTFSCQAILLGGGVTHNQRLRQKLDSTPQCPPVYWPGPGLSLDNAAMIAGLGYQHYLKQGHGDDLSLDAATRIPFESKAAAGG